jgi:hypothetical protein
MRSASQPKKTPPTAEERSATVARRPAVFWSNPKCARSAGIAMR